MKTKSAVFTVLGIKIVDEDEDDGEGDPLIAIEALYVDLRRITGASLDSGVFNFTTLDGMLRLPVYDNPGATQLLHAWIDYNS